MFLEASGGFTEEGKIVKGVASEYINGALPLYICPEHWQIAKLLMKPILGWTVTLDPLGYSKEQKKTIPFLLLMKIQTEIIDHPEKEFANRMFGLILETCEQILQDPDEIEISQTFKEQLQSNFFNYLKTPEIRTTDIIANNYIFIMQLFVAMRIGWIEKIEDQKFWDEFFEAIVEEEMRRQQKVIDEKQLEQTLINLFNISQDIDQFGKNVIFINNHFLFKVKEKIDAGYFNSLFENDFKNLENEAQLNMDSLLIKEFEEMKFQQKQQNKQNSICDQFNSLFENNEIQALLSLKQLFIKPMHNNQSVSKFFQLNSEISFLCFCYQLIIQQQNTKRKQAFKFKLNCNYKNEEECKIYFQSESKQQIQKFADLKYKLKSKLILQKKNVENILKQESLQSGFFEPILLNICEQKDIIVSNWAGGSTQQFCIYPENSSLKDRNFLFRISSATINQSPSVFSNFDNYKRIIMNLEDKQDLILEDINTKEQNTVKQYEQFQFEGSDKIQSYGITTDFNLIFSPKLTATLEYIKLDGNNNNNNKKFEKKKNFLTGLYLIKGDANIKIDQKNTILKEGSFCLINLQNLRAKTCEITKSEQSPKDCEFLYFEISKQQLQIDYDSYDFSNKKDRNNIIKELIDTNDDLHAMNLFKLLGKTGRIFYFYQFKKFIFIKLIQLQRGYVNNIISKIMMLMTGKYEGEVIFQKWVDEKFYPKGTIVKALYKVYNEEKQGLDVLLN